MTDDRLLALARRAVESHRWRWMPGMLRLDGYRACHRIVPRALNPAEDVPDLTDPATLGCLLALVREAYRDPSKLWEGHVEVRRDHRTIFYVMGFHHDAGCLVEDILAWGCTEVEALVCALETAP